jgi:hypothetical protein
MKDTGETFEIWMPKCCVQNIIFGKMYVDQYGSLQIVNRETGRIFELKFEGFSGMFKSLSICGSVTGALYEADGKEF